MTRIVQFAGSIAFFVTAIGIVTLAIGQQPEPLKKAKIRQALEGGLPVGETGDGVLDDVIGIIQQRGSILDGSSLDPASSGGSANTESSSKNSSVSAKAFAAEQLLRAARLLERVDPNAKDRIDLVRKMRAEAVKLLSE